MTARKTAKARTTRKIIGSLGVLGAAAAVAGLGTFGTFTDSTTPVNAQVATGTLSIDLNAANTVTSLSANGFVPGDSVARTFDLVNSGSLSFNGLTMTTTAPVSSILDTDKTNGLQLSVQSCAPGWTETKLANGGATYACSVTPVSLYSGPAVTSKALTDPTTVTSLAPGKTDHLMVALALPTSADNTFQGKTSTLSLAFTGTQASGTDR